MRSYRKIIGGFISLGLLSSLFISPVQAAKKPSKPKASKVVIQKPSQPSILSITSSTPKKNRVNLTINFSLPESNGGAAITATRVSAKGATCTAAKTKTSCTIKNVKVGRTFVFYAQSKNKKGFGAKSVGISHTTGAQAFVSTPTNIPPVYTPPVYANPGPPPVTDKYNLKKGTVRNNTSRSQVLTTKNEKWVNFTAFPAGFGTASVSSKSEIRPLAFGDVSFNVGPGIVGLAQPDGVTTGSGLLSVDSLGRTVDAVATGYAKVQSYFVAPNGNYYVFFTNPISLVAAGPACIFAEVSISTGIPKCIDETLTYSWWNNSDTTNNAVQFDSSGAIFYKGQEGNKTVLKKYLNGNITSIINDNISINDFLVLPDSTIIVSGATNSTGTQWVRKFSPSGSITNLVNGAMSNFLTTFNDNNVYIGLSNNNNYGVKRYLVSQGVMDPKYWIGGNGMPPFPESHYNINDMCQNIGWQNAQGFCSSGGGIIRKTYSVLGQKNFVVSGYGSSNGTVLMQYYPVPLKATSEITNITLSQNVISNIILAGTNAAGTNLLTIFDTGTGDETIVLDASNEVEIYNMTYVASTNKIMFDGLRFSDGKFVVGAVSLS